MSSTQCFVIKRGTKFDQAVKKHFETVDNWTQVFEQLSLFLGETITHMALTTRTLVIDPDEILNKETKMLFKKSGEIKNNSNKAKEVFQKYLEIVDEAGLSDFKELRDINFSYGVMRRSGEDLESYRTSENDIYYKASFDLEERSRGLVIPISEVEYQEKYLEELKNQENNKKETGQ